MIRIGTGIPSYILKTKLKTPPWGGMKQWTCFRHTCSASTILFHYRISWMMCISVYQRTVNYNEDLVLWTDVQIDSLLFILGSVFRILYTVNCISSSLNVTCSFHRHARYFWMKDMSSQWTSSLYNPMRNSGQNDHCKEAPHFIKWCKLSRIIFCFKVMCF